MTEETRKMDILPSPVVCDQPQECTLLYSLPLMDVFSYWQAPGHSQYPRVVQAGYVVDECGVCGGTGDSCALVLSLQSDSLAATSAPAMHPFQVRHGLSSCIKFHVVSPSPSTLACMRETGEFQCQAQAKHQHP